MDSGKKGGVWQIAKGFMEGKIGLEIYSRKKGCYTLHHLFTPRESNRIPSAQAYLQKIILPREIYDWELSTIRISGWQLVKKLVKNAKRILNMIFVIPAGIFLRFVLPVVLATVVLFLGSSGYVAYHHGDPFGNAIFFAVNLITFNESVFDADFPDTLYWDFLALCWLLTGSSLPFILPRARKISQNLGFGYQEKLGEISLRWSLV